MQRRDAFTKVLAIVGTGFLWFPLLVPVVFSLVRLVQARLLRVDYLAPGELFPVAVAGGMLLIWAAVRARAYRGLIGGGVAGAAASLIGSQVLAVVTGLASGEREPAGWRWALVVAGLAALWAALIVAAVGGVLLLRRLFRRPSTPLPDLGEG